MLAGVTLVHCPIVWAELPQKDHVATFFLWFLKRVSVISNSDLIAIRQLVTGVMSYLRPLKGITNDFAFG